MPSATSERIGFPEITVNGTSNGQLYTVSADLGTIHGTDADSNDAGFQVAATGPSFSVDIVRPTGIGTGTAKISVEQVTGEAYGDLDPLYEPHQVMTGMLHPGEQRIESMGQALPIEVHFGIGSEWLQDETATEPRAAQAAIALSMPPGVDRVLSDSLLDDRRVVSDADEDDEEPILEQLVQRHEPSEAIDEIFAQP